MKMCNPQPVKDTSTSWPWRAGWGGRGLQQRRERVQPEISYDAAANKAPRSSALLWYAARAAPYLDTRHTRLLPHLLGACLIHSSTP